MGQEQGVKIPAKDVITAGSGRLSVPKAGPDIPGSTAFFAANTRRPLQQAPVPGLISHMFLNQVGHNQGARWFVEKDHLIQQAVARKDMLVNDAGPGRRWRTGERSGGGNIRMTLIEAGGDPGLRLRPTFLPGLDAHAVNLVWRNQVFHRSQLAERPIEGRHRQYRRMHP